MRISELIKDSARRLRHAGVENGTLDARILLEKVLDKPRSFLIANSEYELTKIELSKFEELLKQRIERKPVSQIVGIKEFYGREFKVSGDVLTPRPETEFIIEAALKLFDANEEIDILDLGTGSGCILVTLLAEFKNANGMGVDISKEALAIAEQNAYSLGIERAKFELSNWLDCFDKNTTHSKIEFDLIISNPPYIPPAELKSLDAEVKLFEPEIALSDGNDGLDCYREIADNLQDVKFKYLILEIGINQKNDVVKIFTEIDLQHIETINDLAGIARTLVFKSKTKS